MVIVTCLFYTCTKDSSETNNSNSGIFIASESRSLDNCVPDFNEPGWDCNDGVYTNNIGLPQYPNCYLSVSIPYRTCAFADNTNIELGKITITGSSCFGANQYSIELAAAAANGTLAQFNNDILAQIYGILTPLILTGQAQVITNSVSFNYVISQCTRTYLREVFKYPFSYFVPVTENCGTKCCSRKDEYEKVNGVWVLQSSEIQEQTENCLPTPGFESPCSGSCSIWRDF